jgi:hypothetical protein
MNATDIDKINAQAARLKDAAAGVPARVPPSRTGRRRRMARTQRAS